MRGANPQPQVNNKTDKTIQKFVKISIWIDEDLKYKDYNVLKIRTLMKMDGHFFCVCKIWHCGKKIDNFCHKFNDISKKITRINKKNL
jgi:hypothetical protein